jgi:hypothetical protein
LIAVPHYLFALSMSFSECRCAFADHPLAPVFGGIIRRRFNPFHRYLAKLIHVDSTFAATDQTTDYGTVPVCQMDKN